MIGRITRSVLAAVLVGAGLVAAVGTGPASAGEFTVTSGEDSGPGTLRQAFLDANVGAGDDTITVDPTVGTIALTTASLDYSKANRLTILANGVVIETDGSLGGLSVIRNGPAAGILDLQDLTIRGNSTSAAGGGAISTQGNVELLRVVIEDNHASGGSGGAIEARGDVLVTDSTIRGNTSDINGGGLEVDGTLTLVRSTLSDNQAPSGTFGNGGGAVAEEIVATNSTVTDNTAGGIGGGLSAFDVTLEYSTVASNTAPIGANIFISAIDTLVTTTSVVADPQGGGENCFFEAGPGTASSGGYNFDSDGSCFPDGSATATDQIGGDPLLGLLGDNGGPTQTRVPATGSPLLDAIPLDVCTDLGFATDQRGEPRPGVDAPELCDIGAVEVQGVAPVPAPLVIEPTFTG